LMDGMGDAVVANAPDESVLRRVLETRLLA